MKLERIVGRVFNFLLPKKMIFGFGASKKVVDEVKAFGSKEALLVTDKNLLKAGIADEVKDSLKEEW